MELKQLASLIEKNIKIPDFAERNEIYVVLWASPGAIESFMFYLDLGINLKHLLPKDSTVFFFFYSLLGSDLLYEIRNRNITGISC
jgi:hypothetical protein